MPGIDGTITKVATEAETVLSAGAKRSVARIEKLAQEVAARVSVLMEKHPKDVEAISATAQKVFKNVGKLVDVAEQRISRVMRKPVADFIDKNGKAIEALEHKLTPQFMEDLGKLLDRTGAEVEKEIHTKGFLNFVKQSASAAGDGLVKLLRQIM